MEGQKLELVVDGQYNPGDMVNIQMCAPAEPPVLKAFDI